MPESTVRDVGTVDADRAVLIQASALSNGDPGDFLAWFAHALRRPVVQLQGGPLAGRRSRPADVRVEHGLIAPAVWITMVWAGRILDCKVFEPPQPQLGRRPREVIDVDFWE